MAHLLDKDALIAEIESLINKGKYCEEYDCAYRDGNNAALYALKNKLNTLEVKEVDLEKKIEEWLLHGNITDTRYDDYCDNDIIKTAKHFFELGLKAQQNINIDITNIDKVIEDNGVDPNSKEAKMFKESYYMALEKLKAQKGE